MITEQDVSHVFHGSFEALVCQLSYQYCIKTKQFVLIIKGAQLLKMEYLSY